MFAYSTYIILHHSGCCWLFGVNACAFKGSVCDKNFGDALILKLFAIFAQFWGLNDDNYNQAKLKNLGEKFHPTADPTRELT